MSQTPPWFYQCSLDTILTIGTVEEEAVCCSRSRLEGMKTSARALWLLQWSVPQGAHRSRYLKDDQKQFHILYEQSAFYPKFRSNAVNLLTQHTRATFTLTIVVSR